jgi:phage/conjugal plasmid C-4 type zinc finger TraR family protein
MAGYGSVDDAWQCAEDVRENQIELCKLLIPSGDSLHNCIKCGEVIPETRRIVLPGVKTCILCQKTVDMHRPKIKVMRYIL